MSDQENPHHGASGNGRDGKGQSRRRRRLPVRATLRLDDDLPANEQHPLASAAPETRAAGRLRLIATVLARLAALARKR